jgi:hypothetical protein
MIPDMRRDYSKRRVTREDIDSFADQRKANRILQQQQDLLEEAAAVMENERGKHVHSPARVPG